MELKNWVHYLDLVEPSNKFSESGLASEINITDSIRHNLTLTCLQLHSHFDRNDLFNQLEISIFMKTCLFLFISRDLSIFSLD